jgi:RNA polymerase primary sigma factor
MAQEGNEWALRKLVEGNLDWAIEAATRAWQRNRFMNVPLEDVVSEAVIALIETIHRFDLNYPGGLKHNWQWLSRSISRALIDQRFPFRYPTYTYDNGGCHTTRATPYYRLIDSERYQVTKRGMKAGRVLQPEEPICPVRRLIKHEALESVLAILKPREREVLSLRFGIDPRCQGRELTLETVGRLLGITRERSRQIEMRAVKRLRHNLNELMPFALNVID